MEQPVSQDLGADVLQRGRLHVAEQMVPLQHLMQQDAVEKTTKAEAEKQTRPFQVTQARSSRKHCVAHRSSIRRWRARVGLP
jgi:hypothetical protein